VISALGRLLSVDRLMIRKKLAEASTWELADELYRFRWRELRKPKKRPSALARRALEATQILVDRHSGLLCQIASRSGLMTDKKRLENYVMRTVFKLRDGTWGSPAGNAFAVTLWNCVLAQLRADMMMTPAQEGLVQNLKPKFMLRQFVDEMPHSYEKALLAAGIFSSPTSLSGISSGEIRRGLPAACHRLHQTILKSLASVSALTDRAITDQDLSLPDILQRFELWLIRG